MDEIGDFKLAQWMFSNADTAKIVAGGSEGPPMSPNDLIAISDDPEATAAALKFDDMHLHRNEAIEQGVAVNVARMYTRGDVEVKANHVCLTNATTGANTIVFHALLKRGNHVICIFPAYSALVQLPKALGANISYLHLRQENDWNVDIDELKALVKPTTRMIILNNPHNPCGSVISTEKQKEILEIAAEHDIIVFCDEIFRPLYHTNAKVSSFVEHAEYDRVIVTGSLSKAWGFPGIRIGWMVTRNAKLRQQLLTAQEWLLQSVGVVDSLIAREVLSQRCCQSILVKNLGYAQENRKSLAQFLEKHRDTMACSILPGGATCFPQFAKKQTGDGRKPVDDLEFCNRLLKETGLLLSPATSYFGDDGRGVLKGHVRLAIHIPPAKFQKTLEILESFMESDSYAQLAS